MRPQRWLEVAPSSSICLFCLNRVRPAAFAHVQRRRFTRREPAYGPAAQAVASSDPEDDLSFPDPDLPPPPPPPPPVPSSPASASGSSFGRQQQAQTFPDPDIPVARSTFSPRPAPRLDEHSVGSGVRSQWRLERPDEARSALQHREKPLIRKHTGGTETQRPSYFRAGVRDASYGENKQRSNNGSLAWGRHLRQRPSEGEMQNHEGSAVASGFPLDSTGVAATSRPLRIHRESSLPSSEARSFRYGQNDFVSLGNDSAVRKVALPDTRQHNESSYKPSSAYRSITIDREQNVGSVQAATNKIELDNTDHPTLPQKTSSSELDSDVGTHKLPRISMIDDDAVEKMEDKENRKDQSNRQEQRESNVDTKSKKVQTKPLIAARFVDEEIQPKRQEAPKRKPRKLELKDDDELESSKAPRRHKGRKSLDDEDSDLFEAAPRGKRRNSDYGLDEVHEESEDLEFEDLAFAKRERKKKRKQERAAQEAAAKAAAQTAPKIDIPPFIAVEQLATTLRVRLEEFIAKLEDLGFEEVANDHVLNFENASLIAMEYGFEAKVDESELQDLKPQPMTEDSTLLPPRPPVVTIMGHVDHGKTTLLDYLRKSSVAATEHGGITQHIGAFSVPMASGKLVTFLDTPGHAAFLSMRQRGATVTDIVILVVAADDSVKPQTIEAIKHAKAAKVPIIVAINKIDKDEADVQNVKQDLLRYDIEVEDFGGDVQAIPVSGKTGQGLDELEEALLAQAETIDMRAAVDGAAEGWVLEASTKKAGRVATILVRRGTIRPGDIIVAGTAWARVRTLRNEAGAILREVGPGMPAEVDGWRNELPNAGDEVLEAPNEQKATSVVEYRQANLTREQDAKDMEAMNESRRLDSERRDREKAEIADQEAATDDKPSAPRNQPVASQEWSQHESKNVQVFFVIKADVSGSTEALEHFIATIPIANHPIELSMLRVAVGPVTESDVDLIATVPAGQGYIISFNQSVPPTMAKQAEKAGVKIFDENIIYKVIDNVKAAIESHLPAIVTKRVLGEAEAAQIFEINTGKRHFIKIAGCKIRNGIISKGKKVRVYRGGMAESSIVYDGTVNSLKSHKKDVMEMRKGAECGMAFDNWELMQAGDIIQCYEETTERRRLT